MSPVWRNFLSKSNVILSDPDNFIFSVHYGPASRANHICLIQKQVWYDQQLTDHFFVALVTAKMADLGVSFEKNISF